MNSINIVYDSYEPKRVYYFTSILIPLYSFDEYDETLINTPNWSHYGVENYNIIFVCR